MSSVKLPKSNTPQRSSSILRPTTPVLLSSDRNSGGSVPSTSRTARDSGSTASPIIHQQQHQHRHRQRTVILYHRRWFMLFVNFLLNTANSTVWVAVSSVQTSAVELYGVSQDDIVLLTNMVYLLFIPGTILSTYLLSNHGLYATGGLGAILLALASWCRVFSAFNRLFALEIVASIIFSIGQPLVMNGVAKFCGHWMAPKERFVATMMYNTVPSSLGAAILELVAAKHVKGPEEVPAYLLLIAGAVTGIAVLFLSSMRERPPTPPEYRKPVSVATLLRNGGGVLLAPPNSPDHAGLTCCHGVRRLRAALSIGPFVSTLFISSVSVLIICAYPASSYNILHPLGYVQSQIDDLTAIFFVTGIIGAVTVAPLADCARTRWHGRATKIFLMLTTICSTGSAVMLYVHAKPNQFNQVALWLGVMSFSVTAAIPIALDTGASAVAESLSESSSSGIMIACGNLLGFILVYVIQWTTFLGKDFPLALFVGITSVGAVSAVCFCSGGGSGESGGRSRRGGGSGSGSGSGSGGCGGGGGGASLLYGTLRRDGLHSSNDEGV